MAFGLFYFQANCPRHSVIRLAICLVDFRMSFKWNKCVQSVFGVANFRVTENHHSTNLSVAAGKLSLAFSITAIL